MERFRNFFKDDTGAVVVIVALFMVVLMGFSAIAIDGGRLYTEKSKLQKAMDSSVLAGAQELIKNSTVSAEAAAIDLSEKNEYKIIYTDYLHADASNNSIEVKKTIPVETTFAKVLGMTQVNVTATAKAKVGSVKAVNGGSPVAVTKDQLNSTALLCDNPGDNSGNCGFLDLGGNGKNPKSGVENFILNGGYVSTEEPIETETGKAVNTHDAFQTLINRDAGKTQCDSPATADSSCERVIIVTIIQKWPDAGKKPVQPIDFVAFWIGSVDPNNDKQIYGKFLPDFVVSGEFGTPTSGVPNYNVYDIKLVE